MNFRLHHILSLAVFCFVLLIGSTVRSDESQKIADSEAATKQAQQAVTKALVFIEQDALKWRKDRTCATCHHGPMTIWAMGEAKRQGYPVKAEMLAELTDWTKSRFVPRITAVRDPRPGWNLVSVPGIYLGLMSQTLPVLSRDEVNQVAVHLAKHQEADGTWLMPPPANGAPPTWESPETLILLALLAWESHVPADPQVAAELQASREKAVNWLRDNKSTETNQATALRLLFDFRSGKSTDQLQPGIDRLFKSQNTDGGWSQAQGIPSDAYATGQTLWALSFVGVKPDRPEIARAVAFLVGSQRQDGSWPMTSRNHPGVVTTRNPIRNPIPITYFGSAWATIGLARSVPLPPDLATRQLAAIGKIREYSGKYEVDEKSPDKPVISVDLRPYDVDNLVLDSFVTALEVFPQLATLHFKSPKITDLGLPHLQRLPQLRTLTLEDAQITDAGLAHLKPLTYLETLNLKGTKVTDAGVADLQQALPKIKIER